MAWHPHSDPSSPRSQAQITVTSSYPQALRGSTHRSAHQRAYRMTQGGTEGKTGSTGCRAHWRGPEPAGGWTQAPRDQRGGKLTGAHPACPAPSSGSGQQGRTGTVAALGTEAAQTLFRGWAPGLLTEESAEAEFKGRSHRPHVLAPQSPQRLAGSAVLT